VVCVPAATPQPRQPSSLVLGSVEDLLGQPGCAVCRHAAEASDRYLAWFALESHADSGGQPGDGGHGKSLCTSHLRDAAAIRPDLAPAMLATQSRFAADAASRLLSARPRLGSGKFRGWRARHGLLAGAEACSVCAARESAARQALRRCQVLPPAASPPATAACLCVHHVLTVRAADPAAGDVAAAAATAVADALIEELAEAFRKNTWANRHEPRGPEITAWQRAAAFLDGRVFGGGPVPVR
jgi:hypothetical protein